jgi:Ca-activated chloride channel homolog
MTKGRAFEASDSAALIEVCEQIDRLERQEIPSLHYRRYEEGYAWFGAAAIVLWMMIILLDHTVWRKIP